MSYASAFKPAAPPVIPSDVTVLKCVCIEDGGAEKNRVTLCQSDGAEVYVDAKRHPGAGDLDYRVESKYVLTITEKEQA